MIGYRLIKGLRSDNRNETITRGCYPGTRGLDRHTRSRAELAAGGGDQVPSSCSRLGEAKVADFRSGEVDLISLSRRASGHGGQKLRSIDQRTRFELDKRSDSPISCVWSTPWGLFQAACVRRCLVSGRFAVAAVNSRTTPPVENADCFKFGVPSIRLQAWVPVTCTVAPSSPCREVGTARPDQRGSMRKCPSPGNRACYSALKAKQTRYWWPSLTRLMITRACAQHTSIRFRRPRHITSKSVGLGPSSTDKSGSPWKRHAWRLQVPWRCTVCAGSCVGPVYVSECCFARCFVVGFCSEDLRHRF